MSTHYVASPMAALIGRSAYTTRLNAAATPVYQQTLSWILLLPLLFYVTATQPSLLHNDTNNALMTTNGALLQTYPGIHPQIVLYEIFMAMLILARFQDIWRTAKQNKLLLSALLFAALSSIWSESPLLSLRMSIDLMTTTAFAFYLSDRFSTEQLMRLLMFVGTVGAILSTILALVLPAYGIYHRGGGSEWQGICSHKNALGVGMAFLLTPVFFSYQRPLLKVGYSALLLFLIGMSQSRGSWFVTAGVILFTAWVPLFRRLKSKESLLLIVATTSAAIAMVVLGLLYLDPLMRFIGKDSTLTGRTDIYLAVLESIFKHPLLGYGFGAFWVATNPEPFLIGLRIHWMTIGYAENGLLEFWLELGTVGLGLVLIMFGKAIRESVRLIRSPFYNPRVGWFTSIIFLELISNIEAGQVMVPGTINWVMTLIAFIGLAKETHEARYKHAPREAPSRPTEVLL